MAQNLNNMLSMAQKLMNNPAQALLEANLNIPKEMTGNPQQIVQHLLNTGQITQAQVNSAMQMSKNPMFSGIFGK